MFELQSLENLNWRERQKLLQQREYMLNKLYYPLAPMKHRENVIQQALYDGFLNVLTGNTTSTVGHHYRQGLRFVPNPCLLWIENTSKLWTNQYAMRRRISKMRHRTKEERDVVNPLSLEGDNFPSLTLVQDKNCVTQLRKIHATTHYYPSVTSSTSDTFAANNMLPSTTPYLVTEQQPPEWLPQGWSLGDPLNERDVATHPKWSDCTRHLDPESLSELTEFLRDIGDAGRNQLARPVEYLAQAKAVEKKISIFFDNQGVQKPVTKVTLPNGKTQADKLDWFKHIYPELEYYYDQSAKACTPVTVFYFSLVGQNLPPFAKWERAAKVEMLNVIFQEVPETQVYIPSRQASGTPYDIQTKVEDSKVLNFFTHPSEETALEKTHLTRLTTKHREAMSHVWAKGPLEGEIKENLVGTPFWKAYLCNLLENSMDHPTLSPKENYAIGNSEMLKKDDLVQAKRLETTKKLLGNTTSTAATSSIADYDERDPKWLLKLPRMTTISKLCAPEAKVLYINGPQFKKTAAENLVRTFDNGEKVGYNTITKNIKTYRVIIRTGVTSYHFRDFDPSPQPYPNAEEFDRYYSYLKREKSNGTHPADKRTEPLISEQKAQYMSLVGISLPDTIVRLKTAQLPSLIGKKRKELEAETGGYIEDLGRKKRRRSTTSSSNGTGVSDFFAPVEKLNRLDSLFQKQIEKKQLQREAEEAPIYKLSAISAVSKNFNPTTPLVFGRCHEK